MIQTATTLEPEALQLLDKGLKYCPLTYANPCKDIVTEIGAKEFFIKQEDRPYVWDAVNTFIKTCDNKQHTDKVTKVKVTNLEKHTKNRITATIKKLNNTPDITVVNADKGAGVIVMNTS